MGAVAPFLVSCHHVLASPSRALSQDCLELQMLGENRELLMTLNRNVLFSDANIGERLSIVILMFGESISFALMCILIISSA